MTRGEGTTKLEETKKNFEKIKTRGGEIVSEAEQINAELSSVNLDGCDSDDIAARDQAERGYSSDFTDAHETEVDTPTGEGISAAQSDVEGLEEGKSKVEQAGASFESMEGMSDIGSDNARNAAKKMEESATEYGEIIQGNQEAIEDAEATAEDGKKRIGSLFRK